MKIFSLVMRGILLANALFALSACAGTYNAGYQSRRDPLPDWHETIAEEQRLRRLPEGE